MTRRMDTHIWGPRVEEVGEVGVEPGAVRPGHRVMGREGGLELLWRELQGSN